MTDDKKPPSNEVEVREVTPTEVNPFEMFAALQGPVSFIMETSHKQKVIESELAHKQEMEHMKLEHEHRAAQMKPLITGIGIILVSILFFMGAFLFVYDRVDTVEGMITNLVVFCAGVVSGISFKQLIKRNPFSGSVETQAAEG